MRIWQNLKYQVISWTAAALLRLWFSTCRVEYLKPEIMRHYHDGRMPAVLVGWHRGSIFSICITASLVDAAVMISKSKDGEYLARAARFLGLTPIRGSSSRGGQRALDRMVEYLKTRQGLYAGTVADGPRGPRRVAKKGMVVLAQRTGIPLIPCVWSCKRAWTIKSAWDKTMLPKPFSRIKVDFGQAMHFPPDLDARQIELATRELTQTLNQLTDDLDKLVGYQEPE